MPLADHCAHEAVYVRNEGTAVVRALPPSTRDTLRYFEMVSVLERFQPLAPLHGATINPQGWYQVVVSDWSLMVLSQSGGSKDAVLLEVPLLSIQDMVRMGMCLHAAVFACCRETHGYARHCMCSGVALPQLPSYLLHAAVLALTPPSCMPCLHNRTFNTRTVESS